MLNNHQLEAVELVLDGGMKAEECAMNVVKLQGVSGSLHTCKNQESNLLNPAKMVIVRGHLISKQPPGQSFLGSR